MNSLTSKEILNQSLIMTGGSLKARYRNSFAGYLWVLLSPLAYYVIQAYVLTVVFKIQMRHQLVFLLLGLAPWIYFSQTLEMVTTSFQSQNHLLKSSTLHPMALILSTALTNLINSITLIFIVLVGLTFYTDVPWQQIYLFPIPFFFVVIATTALGFTLAITNIFFNDTKFILNFLMGILFFASPILYPESYVPENFSFIIKFNPLAYLLRPFRTLLEHGSSMLFLKDQLIAIVACLFITSLTYLIWRRTQNALYFRL